ncbi:DNA repair protein RecN [Rhodoluna sp.]|uniref:DNA repair protein RecN n=1 Tax=Rhodoluna sp. TaxID=1969481 RepID=UPI0025D9305B|nr:DNA repair protein RecN [Rhodoluna sp.]
MIEEIYIRDLGVIAEARLPFGRGLTVLTGETGAGKTMVLTALGLLLGERADSAAIRRGQPQAFVEGRWMLPGDAPAVERAAEAGAEVVDGELILNRSVSSEGRSRASIGGRAAPINVLTEIGEQLVVVHGQSDQIRLRSAAAQREALDQFAGEACASALQKYQAHFGAWKTASTRLAQLEAEASTRSIEAEGIRAAVIELEEAAPQPGEDAALVEQAERLTHIEDLRVAANTAHEALSSESFGEASDALGLVAVARRALEQAASHDSELEAVADELREVGAQLNEVAAKISGYVAGLEEDTTASLQQIQERRALISQLIRKYGPTLDEVIEFRRTASDRLLDLDSSGDQIEKLTGEVAREFELLQTSARELSSLRQKAAAELAEQVNVELAALAMPGATLVVDVAEASDFNAFGHDAISIQLSSYPGAEPRPLGKGASGGELSRIMLAIEVVLAKTEQAPTFIFDEVDAGVGGAAAIEVGRRLAALAQQAQVIVVTHLAQVAAYANQHLRVLKNTTESFTATDVVQLSLDARIDELARMLSGLPESESGRVHAAELLDRARAEFA